jgi:ribosomal protein S18 acetylase RimI-like enzyme
MDAALADAEASGTRQMTLRVNAQNANSISFYERYGFSSVAEEAFRAGKRNYRVLVMEKRF